MTDPCLEAIRQALGKDSDRVDAKELLASAKKHIRREKINNPTASRSEILRNAAQAAVLDFEAEQKISTVNKLAQARKAKERSVRLNSFIKAGLPAGEAVRTVLRGNPNKNIRGAALSVEGRRNQLEQSLVGEVANEMETAGVLDLFTSLNSNPEVEVRVAKQLERLNGRPKLPVDESPAIVKLAEIMKKAYDKQMAMKNAEGAYIRHLKGWIGSTGHDQINIARGGFDKWKAFVVQNLDPQVIADAGEELTDFLKEAYTKLAAGEHLAPIDADTDLNLEGFSSGVNVAKQLSASRVLHWKDAESAIRYMREYGYGSLSENFMFSMAKTARVVALMETYGTNPMDAYTRDLRTLNAQETGFMKAERELVFGFSDIVGNPTVARVAASARALRSMGALGAGALSQITDIPVAGLVMRAGGVPAPTALLKAVTSYLPKGKQARQTARSMGVALGHFTGAIAARFYSSDGMARGIGRLQNTFFKYNGMQYLTDATQEAVALALAENMASATKNKAWSDLPGLFQATLRTYGIEEPEWNQLKTAQGTNIDGVSYLLSNDVPDTLKKQLAQFYIGQARDATTAPTAAGRKWTTSMFGPAGSFGGETLRFIMQLKQFGIQFMYTHVGRLNRTGKLDYTGAVAIVGLLTAFGYVAGALRDLASGKEPKEIADDDGNINLRVLADAAIRGGGFGVFGDFLFASTKGNTERNVYETIAGPIPGDAISFLEGFRKTAIGEKELDSFFGQQAGTVKGYIPFNNLFYTKLAVDYLAWNGLLTAIDPGALPRAEQRIQKDFGQDYWLPPTENDVWKN